MTFPTEWKVIKIMFQTTNQFTAVYLCLRMVAGGFRGVTNGLTLVNVYITMEHHHFWWVNQLFLWPFSIAMLAMLVYRVYKYGFKKSTFSAVTIGSVEKKCNCLKIAVFFSETSNSKIYSNHDGCILMDISSPFSSMNSLESRGVHVLKICGVN